MSSHGNRAFSSRLSRFKGTVSAIQHTMRMCGLGYAPAPMCMPRMACRAKEFRAFCHCLGNAIRLNFAYMKNVWKFIRLLNNVNIYARNVNTLLPQRKLLVQQNRLVGVWLFYLPEFRMAARYVGGFESIVPWHIGFLLYSVAYPLFRRVYLATMSENARYADTQTRY